MHRKPPPPVWAVAIVIALLTASALSAQPPLRQTATPIPVQPPESQSVILTLECVDSSNIRFEVKNVGPTDTALRLGSILANAYTNMSVVGVDSWANRAARFLSSSAFFHSELPRRTENTRLVAAVGDTANDRKAAERAGVGWNIVLSGAHDRTTLAAEPHTHLLASVADLPDL